MASGAAGRARVQVKRIPKAKWKGTLEGTILCFIYHKGIQEGTFPKFLQT